MRTGKKWIRIQVISLNYLNFLTKQNFQICSLIFMLKLDESLKNQEILIISLFSIVQIWVKNVVFFSFWVIFFPLDPDLWIRIFLRIRIQEDKIFRILKLKKTEMIKRDLKTLHIAHDYLKLVSIFLSIMTPQ